MYTFYFALLLLVQDSFSQDDEGPYRGKYIGKINSYHHQVSGDVYAVDDWTILLVDFNYNGTGDNVFFWGGHSGRPGPLGFKVPHQHHRNHQHHHHQHGKHGRAHLRSVSSITTSTTTQDSGGRTGRIQSPPETGRICDGRVNCNKCKNIYVNKIE